MQKPVEQPRAPLQAHRCCGGFHIHSKSPECQTVCRELTFWQTKKYYTKLSTDHHNNMTTAELTTVEPAQDNYLSN